MTPPGQQRPLDIHPEVAAAVAASRPVVALESTLIAHGLPRPDNLEIARELEAIVRAAGAVPATVGVLAGRPTVGLDPAGLARLAGDPSVRKLGVRDLPAAVARGVDGATTVASTAHLAHLAGVRVFATGGLGGVHREAAHTFDESADLTTLAATPVAVVCAGVKSILDVAATLERLETLGVPVVGYRTDTFPGFYLTDSGQPLDWRLDEPAGVAALLDARAGLGLDDRAVVIANPLPSDEQLDPAVHDRVLADGLARAAAQDVHGKDVTPFLLAHFHKETAGRSLAVNITIVRRNARLAAELAGAWAARA
jgi:pseudouridylate synthase